MFLLNKRFIFLTPGYLGIYLNLPVLVPTLIQIHKLDIVGFTRKSVKGVENRASRSMAGVILANKLRNCVIRDCCGVEEGVVTKTEKTDAKVI